jgi:rhodanese-related sulfurtransferase/predicted transcriptional regulator
MTPGDGAGAPKRLSGQRPCPGARSRWGYDHQVIMEEVRRGGDAPGSRGAKAALFDALAEVAGALAAGRRVEIVDLLAQGERSVEEVAAEIGQSMANASHHLRVLARAGLVRSRREGTRIYYRLAGVEVEELWSALRTVAAADRDDLGRLARVYLGPVEDLEVIGREELLERLRAGSVVVLDVRPQREYRAGHIPGARSVPLDELETAIGELPPDLAVVAYCRGPYCVFAPAAVRALRSAGFIAKRLEEGFPEWRRAGLPVAIGDDPGQLPRRLGPARRPRAGRGARDRTVEPAGSSG